MIGTHDWHMRSGSGQQKQQANVAYDEHRSAVKQQVIKHIALGNLASQDLTFVWPQGTLAELWPAGAGMSREEPLV